LKIIKIKPEDLTEQQFKNCKSLSYRSKGNMSHDLGKARRYDWVESMCYLIEDNNKLLAWSFVHYDKESKKNYVNFYTRKTERGKGLGKKLAEKMRADYGDNLIGGKFDNQSKIFFQKINYKTINLMENNEN
jgi:GNAT superfamily N-acetyltransferase